MPFFQTAGQRTKVTTEHENMKFDIQSLAWLYVFAEEEHAKKWMKMVRFYCVEIGMAFWGLGNFGNRPRKAIHNF